MKLIITCIFILITASLSFAAPEPICPGGSNPRSDVFKCFDFDNLSSCPSGEEDACYQANGFSGKPDSLNGIITSEGGAAVGSGFLKLTTDFGGTGGGYNDYSFPGQYDELSVRYYMKYEPGYVNYSQGPHAIQFGLSPCRMSCTIDVVQDRWFTYCTRNAECGSGIGNENLTLIDSGISNGVWHNIEFRLKVDTACADSSKLEGCNGRFEVLLDGEQKFLSNSFNWGGADHGNKFSTMKPFRMYYHARTTEWEPGVAYDNMVISNSISPIGPAANQNSLGQPLSSHAYYTRSGVEPVYSADGKKTYHLNGDCTAPPNSSLMAYSATPSNLSYFSHDFTQNRGYYDWSQLSTCIQKGKYDASRDASIKLSLPSNGGDAAITYPLQEVEGNKKQYCRGSFLIPNSTDTSKLDLISGYNIYQSALGGSVGGYVGLGFDSGKFSLDFRDAQYNGGMPLAIGSTSVDATKGVWHDYEIEFNATDNQMSLWLDGSWVLEDVNVPSFYNDNPRFNCFYGVPDYAGSGAEIYYDDIGSSTVSFKSCKNWGSDCPFDGGIAPPPPTGNPAGPLTPPGPVTVSETRN